MKNLMILTAVLGLMISLLVGTAGFAQSSEAKTKDITGKGEKAQIQLSDEERDQDKFTVDVVSGEVSGIAKNYISIIYDRDYDLGTDYEIMIPVEPSTVLRHKQNFSDIKVGDLVSVEYEKPLPGSKRKSLAKTVMFIQSGVGSLATDSAQ